MYENWPTGLLLYKERGTAANNTVETNMNDDFIIAGQREAEWRNRTKAIALDLINVSDHFP